MKITDPATFDQYYQALVEKDADYVGVFFVGVLTTSVFCIATCHARQKKKTWNFTQRLKQHYGMTFHAFARMYRINSAYEELQGGNTAIQTA